MNRFVALLLVACAACGNGDGASPTQHTGDASTAGDAAGAGDVTTDAASDVFTSHDASLDAPSDAGPEASVQRLVAYASGYGPNIQWLSVDGATGGLAALGSLASFGSAPSFLAVDPAGKHLYAVDESTPGRVGAYAIEATAGALTFQNAVSSGGDGPPFVSVDPQGRWVLVANYTSGTVAVLPIQADGSLGAAVDTAAVGANAHMILADPSDRFVFVPCLGADYVAQFLFDATTGKLTPNAVPHLATAVGAGPRHLAFHPDGKTIYLIDETASTMTALAFDATAGTLKASQTVSTLPAGFTGTNTAAEVHVHPSGKWLFGSNRGDDSIVVFALDASGGHDREGLHEDGRDDAAGLRARSHGRVALRREPGDRRRRRLRVRRDCGDADASDGCGRDGDSTGGDVRRGRRLALSYLLVRFAARYASASSSSRNTGGDFGSSRA